MSQYISNEFIILLSKYIEPTVPTSDGFVTMNPVFDEALKALWFAATGQTFPTNDMVVRQITDGPPSDFGKPLTD